MKKEKKSPSSWNDFVGISAFIVCEDYIHGTDGSLTCIRLCDQLATTRDLTKEAPAYPNINVVIELWVKPDVSVEHLSRAKLSFNLSIINPSGNEIDLDTFQVQLPEAKVTQRTIIPLSGYLGFSSIGDYYFLLKGAVEDGKFTEATRRLIRVSREQRQSDP